MTIIRTDFHNIMRCKVGAFLLLLSLVWSVKGIGQLSNVIEDFWLVQEGNTVLVNFSIKGGAQCDGVVLERTTSLQEDFQWAGEIQGVCGGSEFTEHYSLVDEAPDFGQINYYRLILGTTGRSEHKSISVIELIDEYTVFPQPAAEEIFIKFNNPNNEPVSLKVYDAKGRLVKKRAGLTADQVFINGSDLRPGLFIFQIEFSSAKMLSGRFIRS